MKFTAEDLQGAILSKEGAHIKKQILLSDEVFKDHFPNHPVMPMALICELIYELIVYWTGAHYEKNFHPLVTQINRCYAYGKLIPPNTLALDLKVKILSERSLEVLGSAFMNSEKTKILSGKWGILLFPAKNFAPYPFTKTYGTIIQK